MTNKGWQCPVCDAVYSPSYWKCDNCKPVPKEPVDLSKNLRWVNGQDRFKKLNDYYDCLAKTIDKELKEINYDTKL